MTSTSPAPGDLERTAIAGKLALLAEDDPSARKALARSLKELGLEVHEVADGGRMLVSITSAYRGEQRPDIIITDVQMPVFSGIEVFKGVRAAHWWTPTIIMTAYPTPHVRDTAERLGAVLLVKPLDLDEFERVVVELLTQRARPSRP